MDRSWTAAPGSPKLQPPAAPVSTGAGHGAGEGEWDAGSSVGGSPGRERRCGGRALRQRGGGRETRWGRSDAGEEKRRAGEVQDSLGVIGVAFIGAEDGRQGGGEGRLNGRSNGGGVNGNFKCL
jgi:hypothetical protein